MMRRMLVRLSLLGLIVALLSALINGLATVVAIPSDYPRWGTIALVANRAGNNDIYLLDLSTNMLHPFVINPTHNEDNPAWSPDGNILAYSSEPFRDYRHQPTLREMTLHLLDTTTGQDEDTGIIGDNPVWLDAHTLAFTRRLIRYFPIKGDNNGNYEYYELDLRTRRETPVQPTNISSAGWRLSGNPFADGGQTVYQQYVKPLWQQVVPPLPEAYDPRNIWQLIDPVWSKDGKRLAASALEVLPTGGQSSIIIAEPPYYYAVTPPLFGGSLAWSPDSNYLTFDVQISHNRDTKISQWAVYIADIGAQHLWRVTPEDGMSYTSPTWRARCWNC